MRFKKDSGAVITVADGVWVERSHTGLVLTLADGKDLTVYPLSVGVARWLSDQLMEGVRDEVILNHAEIESPAVVPAEWLEDLRKEFVTLTADHKKLVVRVGELFDSVMSPDKEIT